MLWLVLSLPLTSLLIPLTNTADHASHHGSLCVLSTECKHALWATLNTAGPQKDLGDAGQRIWRLSGFWCHEPVWKPVIKNSCQQRRRLPSGVAVLLFFLLLALNLLLFRNPLGLAFLFDQSRVCSWIPVTVFSVFALASVFLRGTSLIC